MLREGENPSKPRRVVSFMDVLALLVFGAVLFMNVDRLVDLIAVDAFLAYHHNKESSIISVLTDAYDTFDLRCEKSNARIVYCTLALYVRLVSHVFNHEGRFVCPLQGHRMCSGKGQIKLGRTLGRHDGSVH